jgi:hypothetical protein
LINEQVRPGSVICRGNRLFDDDPGGIQHSRINLRLPAGKRNVRVGSFGVERQKTPPKVLRLSLFNNNWLFSNKYFLFGLHRCNES